MKKHPQPGLLRHGPIKRDRRLDGAAAAILVLLLVFHSAVNWIVLRQDTVPFVGDSANIYTSAARFLSVLRTGTPLDIVISLYRDTSSIHPTFFQAVSSLLMLVFGFSQDVAVMGNIPFLALLLVSTFLLGRHLFGREVGILAALLLSFFPAIFSLSRAYMPELALTAMVVLSLYAFQRIPHQTSWKGAGVIGCILGLAALTKPAFSLFLVGPFMSLVLPIVISSIRKRDFPAMAPCFRTTVIMAAAFLLVAGPWYVLHTREFLDDQAFFVPFERQNAPAQLLLGNARTLWLVFNLQVLPPVALLFMGPLAIFLLRGCHRTFILSWCIPPLLFFPLIGISDPLQLARYLPPLLPAIALIYSLALWALMKCIAETFRFQRGHVLLVGILLLLVAGPALVLYVTFGMDSHPLYPHGEIPLWYGDYASINYLGRMSPVDVGFDIGSVASELYRNLSELQVSSIFVLHPFELVSDAVLAELNVRSLLEGKKRFVMVSCFRLNAADRRIFWENLPVCRSLLSSADYVIVGGVTSHEWWLQDRHMFEEEVIPTAEALKAELGNYEVMFMLRNPPGPYPLSLPVKTLLHPSFYWLNESALILRKT